MSNLNASETTVNLLYAVPTIIQIVVIFGCFVFAIFRIRQFPKPATWLAAGLVVILCNRVGGWIGTILLARTTTPQNFVFYNSMLSMLLILIGTTGLAMMVYAVFAERTTTRTNVLHTNDDRTSKTNVTPSKDSNPYSTPSAS